MGSSAIRVFQAATPPDYTAAGVAAVWRTTGARHGEVTVWTMICGRAHKLATERVAPDGTHLTITVHGL